MGKNIKVKKQKKQKEQAKENKSLAADSAGFENFDFGGLPSGTSFKKNMGCGG